MSLKPGRPAQMIGRRGTWCLLFALLYLVIGSWSLATPLFAFPDEAAHVIKAESVVRGQLLGRDVSYRQGRHVFPLRAVEVPGILSNAGSTQLCYLLSPRQPANCAAPLQGPAHDVTQTTYVGTYPPLYYLMVGLPSLATPGTTGVYLMRLMSGALSAAFLATAFVTALTCRRSRVAVLAVCVAATPLVVYLASAVNPSGLEITSAICLWASGLVLTSRWRDDRRLLIRQVGISSLVLVSMRGLSPLWLALILAAIMASADQATLRELAQRRDVRWWGVAVGVCSALAVVWIIFAGANRVAGYAYPSSSSTGYLLGQAIGSTWMWLKGSVGTVGLISSNSLVDVHTSVPTFTLVLWMVILCSLLVMASVVGSRRQRVILAVLIAISLLGPIVLTIAEDRSVGPGWQSRYILPVSVGAPLLAASMIGARRHSARLLLNRSALVGIASLALAEMYLFLANLRRFMVGTRGPLDFFSGPWQPPVPAVVLVVVGVVAEVLLVVVLGVLTADASTNTYPVPRGTPEPIVPAP